MTSRALVAAGVGMSQSHPLPNATTHTATTGTKGSSESPQHLPSFHHLILAFPTAPRSWERAQAPANLEQPPPGLGHNSGPRESLSVERINMLSI